MTRSKQPALSDLRSRESHGSLNASSWSTEPNLAEGPPPTFGELVGLLRRVMESWSHGGYVRTGEKSVNIKQRLYDLYPSWARTGFGKDKH